MRTLAEWLALQEAVHPKGIDLELTRVAHVARALALETPPFPVITVAGTNGKGSTVAHLDALLGALGLTSGMFTSPHFIRYNERIRVGGREVSDAELVAAFERIEAARGATTLTFFEYNTLAALAIFTQRRVDIAVLEVGLGGRLDATNLVEACVAVLASIGFDHKDWLGETLELIGAEKAGIFRAGRPAVLGSADMPRSVFERIAALGARAVVAERDFHWQLRGAGWDYHGLNVTLRGLPPPALAGPIQYRNAATALAALESLPAQPRRAALDAPRVAAGLNAVRLAGRFQIVPGEVEWILDIAHNEPAAAVLAAQLRARGAPRAPDGGAARTLAVIGVLADKDAAAIARALDGLIDSWIACALPGARGGSAGELSERLGAVRGEVRRADSVTLGCEMARAAARPGDRVIVCGSVYTVGPALEWLGLY